MISRIIVDYERISESKKKSTRKRISKLRALGGRLHAFVNELTIGALLLLSSIADSAMPTKFESITYDEYVTLYARN